MPWTLYRYIVLDLLRIIGLTAAILVTVIAFGAVIKPLATDRLLDVLQTMKYIMLVIVPMLQFALPFAAGFGATLVFCRMAGDNEIQAMAASGISYRRILLPVAGLGLGFTLLMVVLTQSVIPRFWAMIVQTLATDVTKVFQAAIQRGEAFKINDMQVYADNLVVQDTPEGPDGPTSRMILLKVAAADLDKQGRIVTDVTASQAVVDIYRRPGQTYLKMVMTDTVALNAETGQLVASDRFTPRRAISIPIVLQSNTKAMTRSQLFDLAAHPDNFDKVANPKGNLVALIRELELRNLLDSQLRASGQVELIGEAPAEGIPLRRWQVHAEQMDAGGRFRAKGSIEIVQFERETATTRFQTKDAVLAPAAGASGGVPVFDLVLGDHDVENLASPGRTNKRSRLVIPGVMVVGQNVEDIAAIPTEQLVQRVENSPVLRGKCDDQVSHVVNEINRLRHEIDGRLISRYATSTTAILLPLLGALLALWRRGSMPLTTYMWAFLPSIVDLILISAGEQTMRSGQAWGSLVIWSGNTLLAGIIVAVYLRIARN